MFALQVYLFLSHLQQSVLNLMGNQVIRHIQNYRKNLICDVVSSLTVSFIFPLPQVPPISNMKYETCKFVPCLCVLVAVP